MEHEVFVPVPAEALRAALTDPARVARCVPGFEPGTDPAAPAGDALAGRLRLRVGGRTITYRGGLRIVERDGAITYEGEGTEARGKGVAEVSLTVVLTPAAEGTGLSFTGALTATGRLAEETGEAREAARTRLLDAFVRMVREEAGRVDGEAGGAGGVGGVGDGAGPEGGGEAGSDSGAGAGAGDRAEAEAGDALGADGSEASGTSDDSDGPDASDGSGDEDDLFADDVFPEPAASLELPASLGIPSAQPPAEAAHARRTMIGRSAEEVDHAPPRGRYAPVPAPEPSGAGATLRWVAPAAALALASAVIVGRALRRRR
ncbi:SRPBCC family protein [Streptomyces termitum]|uniref:SRPBCC family protein n=1 Tax=Streptomyces termitum TaxID=67368 RepID=UPI0033B89199